MQRIIGIDFGTSTTYMNIKRYNGAQPDGDKFSYIPVMFNHGESSGYVATIVRENADGSFDFGEKASEQLEGAKIHTEIKMRLESSDEQERAEARRITREFFKFLHGQYAQQTANLGGADDAEETVISYPVKWKKETAQFMLDAAQDAGFQNVRGMDEAEAAVATVLCQHSGGTGLIYVDKPGYLMLIDMGAGTTDLVVCRYQASPNGEIAIELVTSWPHSADEPAFGGREIDAALERYVEGYLKKSLKPTFVSNAHDMATTPGAAKQWKERNVSAALAEDKTVNTCTYLSVYKTMGILTGDFPAFGRREFESFAESGLRDYARLIRGCLEKTAEADENFSALDLVILTGGHSAWYFAKEMLTGAMDGWLDHPALAAVRENFSRVVSLPNPQTTVSLGLVYSKLPFQLAKYEKPQKTAKPAEVSSPVEVCYKWDDQLLPVIKHFIEENGHFSVMNNVFSRHVYLPPQLRKALHLQDDEEVLFARIVRRCDENDNVERIDGWVYSSKGIYTADLNIPESNFCPWETFMHFEDDPDVDAARKLVFDPNDPLSDTNEEIFFHADLYDLRDLLREKALELTEKAADITEDSEAFYTRAARSFFAERTCDLRAVNFAISRLNIPSGEELFWAEGIIKRAADPGTYAVTERGVYLQGAFGGKHCLSWAEFVSAEWAGKAFAAPSWQNGDNWDASVPLVVKQEKGPLKELHTHLRGFHGTQTAQATTQTPAGYTWDPQLVPVIKHFIQESPAFARRNELRNTSLVTAMTKNFQLNSEEEIFYVHNWGQGPYRGIWGHVITSAGIRANAGANAMAARFMTWWEFLNSHFEYQYDSQQKENHVVISGKGVKVAFRGDQADSIGELHDLLCERAINLQKASAPKAPLQISTQPSEEKSYKWDDRLLSIVKQFIQQDPVIRIRNQIHRYPDHQKLWRQVERNLNFEIYCVVESGNNNKHIICSDGLYVNYYQGYIWGYSYGPNLGIVPWDVFLNGYLDDPNSFEGKIVQEKFGLGGSLCKLQALLREEASKELKEETVSTSPFPIVILPFDAKAMITAMDMQAVLVMLELGTDDTVTIDDRDLPLYQKIRTAEVEKDGYVLVVKEVDPNSVLDSWLFSVRCFGEDMGVMNLEQFEELYRSKMSQQKAPAAPMSDKADWESIIRQVMAMTRIINDPRTNKNTGMLRQVCQVRSGETVLLSFDNTTTQNGKGGVVLTDKAIYTRQWPFSPDRYLWNVFAKYDPCQASYGGINVGHIGIPYCNEAFHDFIWKLNQHMKR